MESIYNLRIGEDRDRSSSGLSHKIWCFAMSKASLGLLVFGLLLTQYANSQCAFNFNAFGSTTAPTTIGATNTFATCSYLGEYSDGTGFLSTNVYTISVSAAAYITIFNAANVAVAYGPAPLSFTPPANGAYKFQWNTPTGCGGVSGCKTTSVTLFGPSNACTNPAAAGTTTSTPAAACAGQSIAIGLSGASTGTGLTYQWQSSTDGVTYANIAGATSSSYSTIQSVLTYYKCIVTCSAGTPSTSIPVQVAMSSFLNCYCASNATTSFDEEIFNVTLGSLNNSSSCGVTGGPGSTVSQYSDYTNTTPAVAIPNLTQGFTYPLSLESGTCGFNYNNVFKVWIDYNQDGVFSDPSEVLYSSPTFTNGPHIETATVLIPTTALTGITRMRVAHVETTVVSSVLPCATYGYGETEDYFVEIAPPLALDAGISAFVNPVVPTCNFNDTLIVTLKNYGTDTLTSANISYQLNTGLPSSYFWTGALAPLASIDVFVGTAVYAAGDNLYAWTSNPNGTIENPNGSYNDSSSIIGLATGLSGIYTVGGVLPDFPDIATALNALNFVGVCGPTTFNIRTGTYFDQFSLGQVTGMNATNTVTIRSEAGNRDSVVFDFGLAGSTSNYVVNMNNADYFHIESITLRNSGAIYGRVLVFSGGSDYNVISDCGIITQANTSTSNNIIPVYSAGANDNFNTFDNNTIVGGSYGVYWYGSGTASLEQGTVFSNNDLVDNYYYGMRVQNQDAVTATNNRVFGNSSYTFRYGMYFSYCDNGSVITHNSVESNATSNFVYGLYVYYCDAAATNRGLIANNMVTSGSTGYTGTNYGLYVNSCGYQNIYNNSVHIANGSATSRAFYLTNAFSQNVKNNTFTNFGGGFAAYVVGSYSVNEMDYNNMFTSGSVLTYYNVANASTLANWQTASGFDANSVSVDPGFYGDYDLHVCSDSLNNAGTALALVTDDIDGQMRSTSTPDIGADEFAPLGLPGFLGPDALICTGGTVNLYAGTSSDQVLWNTTDTTSMLAVTAPGTYTVSVIGVCGISFDTIVVTASAVSYSGFLVADVTTFCAGGSALLTSSLPATSYTWTGGTTNDSLVVTTAGTYTLNISDACGAGSESVAITVNTVPVAGFTTFTSYFTGTFTNTSTGGGTQTYAWDFGDGNTSTAMNPTHIYTTTDTFTVTLTVTNECGTNTTTQTFISSNLGLEEVAGFGTVNVYPNPSTGVYQIDFNTSNEANIAIQVTNVLGQSVYAKNIGSINGTHKDAIDITNEAPGVYYVTIVSGDKTVLTNMLVKQ
jgi:PKD repeat protein